MENYPIFPSHIFFIIATLSQFPISPTYMLLTFPLSPSFRVPKEYLKKINGLLADLFRPGVKLQVMMMV